MPTTTRRDDARETGLSWVEPEARLEALTMALYLAIVLLAESVALQAYSADSAEIVATSWGTALGLVLAHLFAFTLSTRLVSGGHVGAAAWRSGGAQLAAAVTVALVATLPFLFVAESIALNISGSLLAILIGATGFESARARGARVSRALLFGAASLVAAAVGVAVKAALSH